MSADGPIRVNPDALSRKRDGFPQPIPKPEPRRQSPWMSQQEVAEYLGVTPRTIREWQSTSGFPCHKVDGGTSATIRYHIEEVNVWMGGF